MVVRGNNNTKRETETMTRETLEVWVCFDENGDYEVSKTKDDAVEKFTDNIGISGMISVVCLNVNVQLPEPREANIVLADDAATEIAVSVEE
jgi:hypothetical protein